MVRVTFICIVVGFLALYAWRDWYKSLCGLVLLMAVTEHPDMPNSILGVQGLNLWNVLLAVVVMAWTTHRRREGLIWDMPRNINILLLLCLTVVVVGFVRMLFDQEGLVEYAILTGQDPPSQMVLWSEYFINTIKWTIPGLLLFDGCRSRERLILALVCVLGVYILLAIQVIRWVPLEAAVSGSSLEARSAKIIINEIGYHRVNMSMMLAGACWAIFSTQILARTKSWRLLIIVCSLVVLFGQALTAGRAGYATWAILGVIVCGLRWRKCLLLIPLAIALVLVVIPGAAERIARGFDEESRDTNPWLSETEQISLVKKDSWQIDLYTVTAGRNLAWPYVIEEILERPLLGHGREAMQRKRISAYLLLHYNESFPHPHNAYLQLLLDNGVLGAIPFLFFWGTLLRRASSLFSSSQVPELVAVGGVALSLILALLVASMGSQTFYPREGAVGMWCAIGLMLRVWVEKERSKNRDGLIAARGVSKSPLWSPR